MPLRLTGGCHCGAIRYIVEGDAVIHALCHCSDCRRHAGAPLVGWLMVAETGVTVSQGSPRIYHSSMHGRRSFCGDCGTGVFYSNGEVIPGLIDIQSATLDDPEAVPPAIHLQVAERLAWMERAHELPTLERYTSR